VAAIVAASIGARASLLGIDASDLWQQSVEDEQRRGSILMWDVRSVYGDEGELAFAIAIEEVRAAGLLTASETAAPDIAARLLAQAQIREGVAETMRQSSPISSDPRYLLPSGGYDLQLSLADTRAGLGDDLDIDPMVSVSAGDRASQHGLALFASTIVVSLAFLSGALAEIAIARRRTLLWLGWAAVLGGALLALAIEAWA
jgi:hypothetical protein